MFFSKGGGSTTVANCVHIYIIEYIKWPFPVIITTPLLHHQNLNATSLQCNNGTTRRAPLCGGSASDSVAETQRTVPPTHVAGVCFERRRSTQKVRSGYWTVCNNCCVHCVSCGYVADNVQRTAVHLRRALPVRFGRPANANLTPAGTSTAVPPTCVPGATDVRVTQRTKPPHTCSAANVRVTHLAGTLEARRACFRWR